MNSENQATDLDALLRPRPPVLVFLPNTNELQRFVIAGAFEEISPGCELHYVLPAGDAEKMRSAAPGVLTRANTSELEVPAERFAKWVELFESACFQFASLSTSFAIRVERPMPARISKLLGRLPGRARSWAQRGARRLLSLPYLPQPARRRIMGAIASLRAAMPSPGQDRASLQREYDALVAARCGDMAPMQEIIELLDRVNPLYCIVPTSLLDLFCNDVVWACEVRRVGCVLLQSGWDNLSSKGILHSQTPLLGCWGPQSARHAVEIQGLAPSSTHALGAPHYEFLKPATDEEIRAMRAELGVQEAERLVLFGGSFRQFDETSTLLRLEGAIANGSLGAVKIVYRPHPWRAARNHEDSFFRSDWKHVVFDPDMRERYLREQTEAGYIKRNVPMFDMQYLSRLLSSVDAVISPMSTLLIESLILDKPTMAIAFGDGKHSHDPSVTSQMTHFTEARDSGALVWCSDAERLVSDVATLLRPESSEKMTEACRSLLARIVTRQPGTYAERLSDFCRTVVVPEAERLRYERPSAMRGTISHTYGANRIAAKYCAVESEDAVVPGYWSHGWIPAYHNVDPALIALHKKDGKDFEHDYVSEAQEERKSVPQFVAREDQAVYLAAHGYRSVHAIGLPIVYLPKPEVRRVPGSLLVLPPHGHKSHGPGDPVAERYAAAIADLKPRFEQIWVGLTEDDVVKRQWVESFRQRGINVFVSAQQSDPNTLQRLVEILSRFEFVTTNGFGSQIAYAAYCGAKVSVCGPYAEFSRKRMRTAHAVTIRPRLLNTAVYLCSEAAVRKHYPDLFVEPDRAEVREEWGGQEVGVQCRVSPDEMLRLFGWQGQAAARAGSEKR